MAKPTYFQLQVIKALENEIRFWHLTNDIHSPSHGTSIEDMFINLDEWDDENNEERGHELEHITNIVWKLHNAIASLEQCPIRKAQQQ